MDPRIKCGCLYLLMICSFIFSPLMVCAQSTEMPNDLLHFYRDHPVDKYRYDSLPNDPNELCEPQLPAAVKTMIQYADLQFLQEQLKSLADQCDNRLDILTVAAGFFYRTADNPPALQLQQIIQQTSDTLLLAENMANQMLLWLDWCPRDQWSDNFDTLYYNLLATRQLILKYRCQTAYSSAVADFLVYPESQKRMNSHIHDLQKYLYQLGQLTPQDDEANLVLWRTRLAFASVLLSGNKLFSNQLALARRQLDMVECPGPLAIERDITRIAIDAFTDSADYTSLLNRCRQLFDTLNGLELPPAILNALRLRGALLAGQIMQQQFWRPQDYHRLSLSYTLYLQPLIRVAASHTELQEFSRTVIINRLHSSVDWILHNEPDRIGELISKWPLEWLYGLGDEYFYAAPGQYERARIFYQSILTRESDPCYTPAALYKLALCHDQLAQRAKTAQIHWEQATDYYYQLAIDYPDFKPRPVTGLVGDDIPARAIERAAAIVCGQLPKEDNARRLKVLRGLCGILNDQTLLAGRYAGRPAALRYRFFYGQALQRNNQTTEAVAVFSQVPADDTNYVSAQLSALRTRFSAVSMSALSSSDPNQAEVQSAKILPLAEDVCTFIQKHLDHDVSVNAAILLLEIYHYFHGQLNCFSVLSQVCTHHPGQPALARALLQYGSLVRQNESTFLDAVSMTMDDQLKNWLVLTDYCVSQFLKESDDTALSIARSYRQEAAVLAALSADYNQLPDKLQTIVSQARQELFASDSVNTLESIRYRGLFAWAEGDYSRSRDYWLSLRQGTDPDNPQTADLWWQSRYFSLMCLCHLGQQNDALHAAEVLLKSRPNDSNPWQARINKWVTQFNSAK